MEREVVEPVTARHIPGKLCISGALDIAVRRIEVAPTPRILSSECNDDVVHSLFILPSGYSLRNVLLSARLLRQVYEEVAPT